MAVVSELWTYPLKSARGVRADRAEVSAIGLVGDRRWMVTDPQGRFLTAREHPDLLLIEAEPTAAGLRVRFPSGSAIEVETSAAQPMDVTVWRSTLTAQHVPGADEALTDYLGTLARLAWHHDPEARATNPDFTEATDRVSLADGYPILLATTASLAALNDAVLTGSDHPRDPVDMRQLRPNIVLDGDDLRPWAEDDWRRIRIGAAEFRVVKGCPRCVLSTRDPDTAERYHEPIRSLARIRRFDGEVWFGANLVCDTPGATLATGDGLVVLDEVPPGNGPQR